MRAASLQIAVANVLRCTGKMSEAKECIRSAFSEGMLSLGPKHRVMRSIAKEATGLDLPADKTVVALWY